MFFNKKNKRKNNSYTYLLIIVILVFGLLYISKSKNQVLKFFYPIDYAEYVYEYSHLYEVDPYLVFSMIKVESNFNKDAQSHRGAKGLMQITSDTGKWIAENIKIQNYNDDLLFDPEYNIKMGTWYIRSLLNQFDEDLSLAIAAYNGGRGNVEKWLKNKEYSINGKDLHNIPFGETDRYVIKVKKDYEIYKEIYHHE